MIFLGNKNRWILLFISFYLILCSLTVFGQNKVTLQLTISDSVPSIDANNIIQNVIKIHPDSLSAINTVEGLINSLRGEGFLAASIDTVNMKADTMRSTIYLGQKYTWGLFRRGNVDPEIFRKLNIDQEIDYGKPVSPVSIQKLAERLLVYAENNGFPFATLSLDSIQEHNNGIFANLNYIPGPYIVFDTIGIEGTARSKGKYLNNFLRLIPGEPFSQAKVKAANYLLKDMLYLNLLQPIALSFNNNRAYIKIFADKRAINQADGVVGFLPNEENKGKLLITGEFNLKLYNLLQSGKTILLAWQNIRKNAQKLDATYVHPAFLATPMEFKANLYLLKEDTTFLNRISRITLSYPFAKGGKFGLYGELSSSQIYARTDNAIRSPAELVGYNLNSYGISYTWNNLNDLVNPRKGALITMETSLGNKKLRNIAPVPLRNDSLKLNTKQVYVRLRAEKYIRLKPKAILMLRTSAGKIINSQLFRNDLFRLGGLNTLRGFNENRFYSSAFIVGTLEHRFFFEETSFLSLFYDQAYFTYQTTNNFFDDYPSGLGFGLSFATPAGTFNISYALGRSKEEKFNFNTSKIHFGLIGNF